jgi:polyhydroxybutyrate depolymerase
MAHVPRPLSSLSLSASIALGLGALALAGARCSPADGTPRDAGRDASGPDAADADDALPFDADRDTGPDAADADDAGGDAEGATDAADADVGPVVGCPADAGDGVLGGSRPAALKVPERYTEAQQYPLIIELHGRGSDAAGVESYFGMGALADRNDVFVIAPDGTLDSPPPPTEPASFWNATDGCCNLYGSEVDDVAYLRSLICHTQAHYSIDRNKVFIIGGSNGAFMAHRMACDASDLVTAIIALAGVTWNDPTRCRPLYPVSVLQIHGTADTVVPYDGAAALFPGPSPSAPATYEMWAALDHCSGPDVVGPLGDFDTSVPGNETSPVWKPLGGTCQSAVQLWTIGGGGHGPSISWSTRQLFIDWFRATPPNHP